jgi:hypothetical protein
MVESAYVLELYYFGNGPVPQDIVAFITNRVLHVVEDEPFMVGFFDANHFAQKLVDYDIVSLPCLVTIVHDKPSCMFGSPLRNPLTRQLFESAMMIAYSSVAVRRGARALSSTRSNLSKAREKSG